MDSKALQRERDQSGTKQGPYWKAKHFTVKVKTGYLGKKFLPIELRKPRFFSRSNRFKEKDYKPVKREQISRRISYHS